MDMATKYPPLYQCEKCDAAVKVKVIKDEHGHAMEPLIKRLCKCPSDTPILARRKVTLRGKGSLNPAQTTALKITMTVRQFLCWATGRSI